MKIHGFVVGTMLLLASIPCQAENLCVLILEAGLTGEQARMESSSAWESGIMNAFFNNGIIVSSAPMARIPAVPGGSVFPVDSSWGVKEASEGGADLVAIVVLEYPTVQTDKDGLAVASHTKICPLRVWWELKSINPVKVLASGVSGDLLSTSQYKEDVANSAAIAKLLIEGMKER